MKLYLVFFLAVYPMLLSAQRHGAMDSVTSILEHVMGTDQEPRLALDSIMTKFGMQSPELRDHWKIIHRNDSINLLAVSAILDKYGWLSAAESSEKANEVLFLVIQHSNLETQLKYLPVLKAAVKQGRAKPRNYAYLLDRVNMGQGKFQIYGTQFQGFASGKMYLYPVKDEPDVNRRRKKMGIEPLEENAKYMGIDYKVPTHDSLKNKRVVVGMVADTSQQPLDGVMIYLGKKWLATSDRFGEYKIVLSTRENLKNIIYRKAGYKDSPFPAPDVKDVNSFMILLSPE